MKALVLLCIAAAFFYINLYALDPDLGWHIRVGERIWQEKTVPHGDEYSFTMRGYKWVDHEWLVDAWLWWMESRGLWWLVAAIFTALAAIPFFIWIKRAQSALEIWLVLLGAVFASHFVGVRPQMISFFLLFVLLELLERRRMFLLPLLFFLWANLHAGFLIGFVVWGVYAVGYYLSLVKTPGVLLDTRRPSVVLEAMLFAASVGVTFLNPYGLDLYKEIFQVATSAETRNYIGEWQSLLKVPVLSFWLFCGILTSLLIFGNGYRKLKLSDLLVTIALTLLAFTSIRHGLLFIAAVAPVALQGLRNLGDFVEKERKGLAFSAREQKIFHAGLMFLFGVSGAALVLITYNRPQGMRYPDGAAAFLQNQAAQGNVGNIYNEYGWGGYMLWKAPDVPVFIDGRMPHWIAADGNSAMKEYVAVIFSEDDNAWRAVFEKRHITLVLQEKNNQSRTIRGRIRTRVLNALNKDFLHMLNAWAGPEEPKQSLHDILVKEGWRVVYEDDISIILAN